MPLRTTSELITGTPNRRLSARAKVDFPLPVRPEIIMTKGFDCRQV